MFCCWERKRTISLRTPRLLLRRWRLRDVADMFDYAQDPLIGSNAGWKPHTSRADARRAVRENVYYGLVWAVFAPQAGKVIGSIGLYPDNHRDIDDRLGRELGFSLSHAYWGQGLIPEAARAVLGYAFEQLDFEQVSVYHFPDNERCRHTVAKLGFTYERVYPRSLLLYDGTARDCVGYLLRQDQWQPAAQRADGAFLPAGDKGGGVK